jgi:hypothetical protein
MSDAEFDPQGLFDDITSLGAGVIGAVSSLPSSVISAGQTVVGALSGAGQQVVGTLSGEAQTALRTVQEQATSVVETVARTPEVVVSLGSSIQQQYAQPVIETVFEAPVAVASFVEQYAEPASEVVSQAPAAIFSFGQSIEEAAVPAVEAIATFENVSNPFIATAMEPTPSPTEEAAASVFSTATSLPTESANESAVTKKTEESPSGFETLGSTAVLLGAGVVSQVPSWYDMGTNIGTKLADLTYENAIYTKNLIEGRGWGNTTGMVTTGTTEESKVGETTREAIINEISKLTGAEISSEPITGFVLPSVQSGIKSESALVRAGAVGELMVAGLTDWVLANPGTAYFGEVQLADIGAQVLQEGGSEKMVSGLTGIYSLVLEGTSKKTSAETQQKTTQYRVIVSNKPACWGKSVGTSGCP